MDRLPADKYSKGFLTMLAILLTFLLLLTGIWVWYEVQLTRLQKVREEKEKHSSQINP